jgi:hypothetical protein
MELSGVTTARLRVALVLHPPSRQLLVTYVRLVYDPKELPEVTTAGPRVALVLHPAPL